MKLFLLYSRLTHSVSFLECRKCKKGQLERDSRVCALPPSYRQCDWTRDIKKIPIGRSLQMRLVVSVLHKFA